MKPPLKACVSVEVAEVAIRFDGKIFAILDVKFKRLGYAQPSSIIEIYVDISKAIQRDSQN